ncbi:MAG: LytTR family DNA-binding domain-containing protein [candidate division KSB1 bacterium]|nr:LytTR family DNA-binding domain-containing protein [candidate division KSB1 bacterium]MDZ7275011.1 LytTR family DNA-binding domain-containing protein [candidate division KSB1 bacterium]MDZ7286540.1 LytTR family DNA-binding domain-containing protein [candidate division KSB1 bacterium]MDZ7299296.1 LytTR family DNA-binding domain-containing protein [candidate division KSB1 bacterium]MDZ7307364.1 LytTR family DNA-binding domain-containing protein [candidate division KSB1 bacterium]
MNTCAHTESPHTAKIGVVMVDDEGLARAVIREYPAADPELQVLAECANGFEAVQAVAETGPDLLFLDVQVPKLNSFEVLELLDREVAVIFVAAYEEYAVRAFEVQAVDYLLKPLRAERLHAAVARARRRMAQHEPLPRAELTRAARAAAAPLERLLLRDGNRVLVTPLGKIDYLQAQDDHVGVRVEGKSHLKQMTIGELETAPDNRRFVRIHRSYILNVDRLERIELYAKDSRVAMLHDGSRLPVSRAGYARLKALPG